MVVFLVIIPHVFFLGGIWKYTVPQMSDFWKQCNLHDHALIKEKEKKNLTKKQAKMCAAFMS